MRQIGTLPNPEDARRLADYLLTLDISTRVDERPSGCLVWVHREEKVERARQEYEEFVKDPSNPRYEGVEQTAKVLRKKKRDEDRKHIRNSIDLRGRWDYRAPESVPVTLVLVAASIIIGVFSHLGDKPEPLVRVLSIAPIQTGPLPLEVEAEPDAVDISLGSPGTPRAIDSGLERVRRGEVWRLVTPIFLHFTIFHLVFNLFWLNDFAGMIEMRKGSLFLAVLVLTTAAASNLAQYYDQQNPWFGGMSGVVFGLFGYIWVQNRYVPGSGMPLRDYTVILMGISFLLGMAQTWTVASVAHLVGLGVGLAFGIAPIAWRRLVRRR